MTRPALLVLSAALLVGPRVAPAQGFSLPYRTGSSFYQPSFGRYPGGFLGGFNPAFTVPRPVAYGGVGYLSPGGFYDPGFYTTVGPNVVYVPSFAGPVPSLGAFAAPPPPLAGAGAPAPAAPAAVRGAAQPAELRLELPAVADLVVNGVAQPARQAAFVLSGPTLPAGGSHVFNLKASWVGADGARYEWDRAVSVAAGQRGRVTVAAGFKAGP